MIYLSLLFLLDGEVEPRSPPAPYTLTVEAVYQDSLVGHSAHYGSELECAAAMYRVLLTAPVTVSASCAPDPYIA